MGKVWYFWSGIYSSCVVLAALVLKSPGCVLSQEALMELDSAFNFFKEGSEYCRPPNSMAILTKFRQRARDAFAAHHGNPNGSGSSPATQGSEHDTMSLLAGRHGTSDSPETLQTLPTQVPTSSMRSSLEPEGLRAAQVHSQPTPASTLDSPFVGTSSSSSGSVMFPSPSLPDINFYPLVSDGNSIDPLQQVTGNDLYDFTMIDMNGYSDAAQASAVEEAPGTGDYNKQNLWATFIEGIMDDPVALQF